MDLTNQQVSKFSNNYSKVITIPVNDLVFIKEFYSEKQNIHHCFHSPN